MFNSKTYSDLSPAGSNEEAVNSPLISNPPSNQSSSSSSGYGGHPVRYVEPYKYPVQSYQQNSGLHTSKSKLPSFDYMNEQYEPSEKRLKKFDSYTFKTKTEFQSDQTCSYSLRKDDKITSANKIVKTEPVDDSADSENSPKPLKINVLKNNGKCTVCGDKANIEYFGVLACDSCRGFFKRSIKNERDYSCSLGKKCIIDKRTRNHCQGCRIARCYKVGMKKEEVKEELLQEKLKRQEKKKESPARRVSSVDTTKKDSTTVDLAAVAAAELFVDPKIEEFANVSFDPIRQLCLAADKQLASLAEWAKRMPHFTKLNLNDQVKLLQWNWAELLIGGFCYRSSAVTDGILLSTGLHLSKENLEKAGVGALINKLFSEVINKMRKFQIDITEWGCLRAIMLFAPDTKELEDIEAVENIREKYIATLCEYIKKTYPTDMHRLSGLLLRLAPLKAIALQVLEHLFFFKILGNVSIDTFLLEMLDSDNH